MPKNFRKWTNWIMAFLLCFSLVVNVHCLMLVFRYREVYQAPPVWVKESGEYVVAEPSHVTTDTPETETPVVTDDPENRAEEIGSNHQEEPIVQEPVDKTGMTVYLTKSGSKFHRDGCSSLSKSKIAISYEDAVERGFEPCGRCKP